MRKQHSHLRLADRSDYEAKGLPPRWFCSRHEREFRANASHLSRPGAVGCPDCLEERKRQQRKQRRADPDPVLHLALIREYLSEDFARIWRSYCEGATWDEICIECGIGVAVLQGRLRRIKAVLLKLR